MTSINRYDEVASFEKVSFDTWMKSMPPIFVADEKDDIETSAKKSEMRKKYEDSYNDIILPSRATPGSAGYDFFLPFSEICLGPNDTVIIPTGIKCELDEGFMLQLYPRSSHGIRHRISLANTVGIIDSDYYNNEDNEGHIMVALHNNCDLDGIPLVKVTHPITGEQSVTIDVRSKEFQARLFNIAPGTAFCQGIIVPYGTIIADTPRNDKRKGGIGSTTESSNSPEN